MSNIKLMIQALQLRKRVMDLAFNENCSFERFSRLIELSNRLEARAKRRSKKFVRITLREMDDEVLSSEIIG